ncbi:Kyphoscoliosis peptidase [Cercospora beticola]|uniref:Kyphoscoliosis peptidase n=1 Tax=Cercospora beticola TaxID=122368 RepID=A0A2G5I4W3_CERBT|nr:Kyphoscoliosis peptidase [Cercospora beticola]PIA99845.1 Kyphoscoliosis peptidase [Cercospora beticola]WPA99978.1 hypothetical protein RHO25_004598 [Cercospora beticola]CAK1361845.1 unnamed protein product [Cercospora beticola]
MAEEPQRTSIAQRIAALKLQNAGGGIPIQNSQGFQKPTTNGSSQAVPRPRPPPPPRPSVPARPDRAQASSVPPGVASGPSPNRAVGNEPDGARPNGVAMNGTRAKSRPPLPGRTSTQSSQAPALPSRTPSGPSPALPPRRPSEAPSQKEFALTKRASNESISSIATARSSTSAISNATSYTSVGGERYKIRAPDYDPSSLPALPPKRTKEEKEAAERKYNGTRPLRHSKSTPRIAQVQEGTTPPPMPTRQPVVPPPVPTQTDTLQNQTGAYGSTPVPKRAQPPPPPVRQSQPPLPVRASTQTRVEPIPAASSARADLAPPPRPRVSALSMGFGNKETSKPAGQDVPSNSNSGVPPPIPASSKPDLAALKASKPRFNATATPTASAPAAGALAITSYSQFSEVLATHRIVMADFWAPWCGPCRNFAPDYERLAKEYCRPNQIAFVKINTDENKDIAQAYKIECWPTLIAFEHGAEIDKSLGANEYWLNQLIEERAKRAGINLSAPVPAAAPVAPSAAPTNSCLHCRDFSGPDGHAARFPRQSIPSQDVGWLAHQLTSPFPSLTDKARAIFAWLHHNIAYDTVAFFGNNVKGSTPQSTLQSGLAVCEGYAGLFAALAMKVGMECFVLSGASKGFGFTPLQPGQPIPPFASTHAWNVVKIDNGEWKLIDSCWGSGSVTASQTYEKKFKPDWFTMSNDIFGLSHYPQDRNQQYRTDGRSLSWEEYSMASKDGTGATVYDNTAEEGLAKTSFRPAEGKINLAQQGPTTRFSFQKICRHWDPIKNGSGPSYLFVLLIDAQEKKGENNLPPFNTNGEVWWCDVPTQHLGHSGQKVTVIGLTQFNGRDGRGLTVEDYMRKKGRAGWASTFIASWEIA